MGEILTIVGCLLALFGGFDLLDEDKPREIKKNIYKIGGGIVLALTGAALNKYFGI